MASKPDAIGTVLAIVHRLIARWLADQTDIERASAQCGADTLRMSSITYRIATGTQAGRKVVTLQTLPGDAVSLDGDAGKVGGFSLHAGVAAEAREREKREPLCRYIARPAISEKRLSIPPQGLGSLPAQDAVAERLPMLIGVGWTSSPCWPRWCRHHAST